MGEEESHFVWTGGQFGDKSAGLALRSPLRMVSGALSKHTSRSYSSALFNMILVLRVDGTGWHWEMSGVHRIRLQKKQGYVTADIHFAKQDYVNASERDLTVQLLEYVNEAAKRCVERIRRAKLDFDAESFFADLENADQEVRSSISSPGGQ